MKKFIYFCAFLLAFLVVAFNAKFDTPSWVILFLTLIGGFPVGYALNFFIFGAKKKPTENQQA
jgi:hypothetical protein